MKPIKLSISILSMTLLTFAILGTLIGSSVSGVLVSKRNLEKSYLVDNEFYAQKLTATTDSLFYLR